MGDDIFQAVYETMKKRDTRFDGQYYVGIRTTGIVCRPSCRSRLAKPENVKIFSSVKEALNAGFRPCKRCKPETPSQHGPDAELSEAVLKLIREQYKEPLTLDVIANKLMMSPYHLQRIVKRTTGLTPNKHLHQMRITKAKEYLETSEMTINRIAKEVGFKNASHFSASFKKITGHTPNEYRTTGIGG
ncbi:bifunctional transcriptional activator/DNA repair enzyme AdaA [Pseudalkalibacillus berkeleyi]|uniref:Helix-turn-helix domain-containing protein n=1 Tax=Pseudalkalibacillus berkeleyi TaxID=1069813 RepID=A0ABS9H4A1_9BACL|nr:Ada metal-binding domain-containing protein [Pseudalkalibacillus berkeleyi]MCF6138650.1 helix-turn-helix domain-containing protein [Pseudalkalibacillus berkeleyi]